MAVIGRLGSALGRTAGFFPVAVSAFSTGCSGATSTQPRLLAVGLLRRHCSTSAKPTKQVGHIRNVAVIAHVDHGKTTLVDQLLAQCGMKLTMERAMDNIALEKERGITIMSKNTSIQWAGKLLNIVDTPGHQDFGGEVERVLGMVDGVLLVVDATEGPMPQTKFVLSKALSHGLKPIVVINKADRNTARLDGQVEDEIFELFCNLNANDDQLGFPVLYASARDGWCVKELGDERKNIHALYDAIIEHVPPPTVLDTNEFSMLVTNIEYDNYVGRIVTGKIHSGVAQVGDQVVSLTREGARVLDGRIVKVFRRRGLDREEIPFAEAGDIVSLAGLPANVTDTVCSVGVSDPIPTTAIDPPTIGMTFSVNDSPLQGKGGGTRLTSNLIKERLLKECENNITIQVKPAADSDSFEVHGRGELQLGILIETMRREGYEMTISPPRVLLRVGEDGRREEPWEEVTVDLPSTHSGTVISSLQERGGEMLAFRQDDASARVVFAVPSRGLMGFRSEVKSQTSGSAVINSTFHGYRLVSAGSSIKKSKGKLIASIGGIAMSYALKDIEARGVLFVAPGQEVYKGMVVGECARDHDLEVNPTRAKKATNIRAAGSDEFYRLTPPKVMSLEESVAYLAGDADHQLEVTPSAVRMRRRDLNGQQQRRKAAAE
eukprot:comp23886_c0_seq1/m.41937 comp23886_c0_seq1/g.41937  ORF comp23886_c0_seq1/g.41937 comp23886_c0_seq1/m.41937 type:complete len:662 (-) comp23886_c0_seq1:139-2124(-)